MERLFSYKGCEKSSRCTRPPRHPGLCQNSLQWNWSPRNAAPSGGCVQAAHPSRSPPAHPAKQQPSLAARTYYVSAVQIARPLYVLRQPAPLVLRKPVDVSDRTARTPQEEDAAIALLRLESPELRQKRSAPGASDVGVLAVEEKSYAGHGPAAIASSVCIRR